MLETVTDYSCLVNSESRMLEIQAQFPRIADKNLLYETEAQLRAAYDITSARIFPHYPPELFTPDYMPQVILELQRIGVVSKGFFDNYTYDVNTENRHITISVQFPDAGVELLCHAQTPEIIAGIIRSEFGLEYTVELCRAAGYNASYEEYQQRQRKFDMNVIFEEEKNRPAPVPDEPAPPPEILEPPKPHMPSVGNADEFAEKLSDTTYKCGNTVFDIENAELVFGEDFDIVPTPIAALNSPRRNITVLGCVFNGESKQNRKGDKTIFNFDMTDYAASISVKAIMPNEEIEPLVKNVTPGAVIALHGKLQNDKFDNELCMSPDAVKLIGVVKRKDKAEKKRVELH
nr:hypothetical protein [Clostridia bacterium]